MDLEIAINRIIFIFGYDNVIVEKDLIKIFDSNNVIKITTLMINNMKNEEVLDLFLTQNSRKNDTKII